MVLLLILIGILCFLLGAAFIIQPSYISRSIDKFKGRLPPGPFGWPIMGASAINTNAPWETFTNWANQYGPIISFFNGSEFTVVLSDSAIIKSAMKNPAFDGRPLNHSSKQYFGLGIGFAEGETWKLHRKLVVSSMRLLATHGTSQMQFDEHLKICAAKLVDALKESPSTGFDPLPLITTSVADVLSFLIFKDALTSEDGRFDEMIECCAKVFSVNPSTDIMNTFPFLKNLPKFKEQHKFFADTHKHLFDITRQVISERKTALNAELYSNEEPVDFTETMFWQRKKNDTGRDLTDDEIIVMATELYMAGTQDTINVLHWIFLLLILYPNVQQKLQEHIDQVLDKNRAPSLFDRPALTYIEALILESQRFSSSMPFPLPHRVVQDTTFMGYQLPADTAVIINAFAINNDEKLWKDPDQFRPERFLDKDGKLNNFCNQTLGFGKGRRSCPGEAVGKLILLVFITTVLQNLTLVTPEGSLLPTISRSNGTASQPPLFEIFTTKRGVFQKP